MRLLVTGASGLVGGAVARRAAAAGHEVIGIVGKFPTRVPGLVAQHALDLEAAGTVVELLRQVQPDAIVNGAAASEPGDCDANPVRARRLNVDLPDALARFAREHHVRLVHLSTEQVFGGDRAPYRVTDPVAPINFYGALKAASEQAVHADPATPAATVRAPLLMGNSPSERRSLHERLLADWQAGRTVRLFSDEIRQVAHADNLADLLIELCTRRDFVGVFHWAGREALSRYELGARIRAHFGLSETQAPIVRVHRADNPAAVRGRPADLRLDLSPLVGNVATPPQSFEEQLRQLHVPAACRDWIKLR